LEKGTQTVITKHLTITTKLGYTKHEKLSMFVVLVSKIEEKDVWVVRHNWKWESRPGTDFLPFLR